MSQQKLDSRRQQNTAVCSKNKSPLAPQDGSGGRPTRRQQQRRLHELLRPLASYYGGYVGMAKMNEKRKKIYMYLMESYVERLRSAEFSYPSVQCTGLISWREKHKFSRVVVVRRLDAFPSLPGIVPHRKKERRAPARPVGPLT
ncbi:hypothetical protein ACFE04_019774 [Oxalis oulophora]